MMKKTKQHSEHWLYGDKEKGISFHKTPAGRYSAASWLRGSKKHKYVFDTLGEVRNWGEFSYKHGR